MTSAEVEQRLEEGLERVARLDDRAVNEIRQDAIRSYLARRGVMLLDKLSTSSPGTSLTHDEALRIATEEVDEARQERRR